MWGGGRRPLTCLASCLSTSSPIGTPTLRCLMPSSVVVALKQCCGHCGITCSVVQWWQINSWWAPCYKDAPMQRWLMNCLVSWTGRISPPTWNCWPVWLVAIDVLVPQQAKPGRSWNWPGTKTWLWIASSWFSWSLHSDLPMTQALWCCWLKVCVMSTRSNWTCMFTQLLSRSVPELEMCLVPRPSFSRWNRTRWSLMSTRIVPSSQFTARLVYYPKLWNISMRPTSSKLCRLKPTVASSPGAGLCWTTGAPWGSWRKHGSMAPWSQPATPWPDKLVLWLEMMLELPRLTNGRSWMGLWPTSPPAPWMIRQQASAYPFNLDMMRPLLRLWRAWWPRWKKQAIALNSGNMTLRSRTTREKTDSNITQRKKPWLGLCSTFRQAPPSLFARRFVAVWIVITPSRLHPMPMAAPYVSWTRCECTSLAQGNAHVVIGGEVGSVDVRCENASGKKWTTLLCVEGSCTTKEGIQGLGATMPALKLPNQRRNQKHHTTVKCSGWHHACFLLLMIRVPDWTSFTFAAIETFSAAIRF